LFIPSLPSPFIKTLSGAQEYVLDLRGNPGGSVQAAVEVASVFLDGEKVMIMIMKMIIPTQ